MSDAAAQGGARPELALLLRDAAARLDKGEIAALALVVIPSDDEMTTPRVWMPGPAATQKKLATGLLQLAQTIVQAITDGHPGEVEKIGPTQSTGAAEAGSSADKDLASAGSSAPAQDIS